MKKGFTLVELLAVIVILAVILSIAIPSISSIIENAQVQAYHDNEKLMVKAVKTYLGIAATPLPINIGDTSEVTLDTLQTNGYISAIKDPKDKGQTCDGYVLITKIDTGNYNYKPYLNCESDIGSSTEDRLLAHYTFDDFQEPTTNYVPNGAFQSQTLQAPYSNIMRGTVSIVNGDGPTSNKLLQHVATGADSYTDSYLGTTGRLTNATAGETWTASIYVKADQENVPVQIYIFGLDDNNTYTVLNNLKSGNYLAGSEWKRISVTFTTITGVTGIATRVDNDGGTGVVVYWNGWQLEKKAYATDFVNGSRTGIIKDYSNNSNHVNLPLATTPRWIEESSAGEGAYSFDGIDDYINVGAVSENILRQGKEANDFTLSAWIKPSATQDTNGSLILARQGWHDGLQISTDGRIAFGIFDENNVNRAISSSIVTSDVWHNVVATYTNRTMYLYVDGKLVGTNNYFNLNPTVKFKLITNSFLIGAAVSSFRFKGSIDEARIYERALSADEIKYNYDMFK